MSDTIGIPVKSISDYTVIAPAETVGLTIANPFISEEKDLPSNYAVLPNEAPKYKLIRPLISSKKIEKNISSKMAEKKLEICQPINLEIFSKKNEHKHLWQYVKELLTVGDPCVQWEDEEKGLFILHDQVGLAAMWACYRELSLLPKLHPITGIFTQVRNFLYPPKGRKEFVKKVSHQIFQFEKKFYKSWQFVKYNFISGIHPQVVKYMKTRMEDMKFLKSIKELGSTIHCQKGCGSTYLRMESCQKHESVCTFKGNLQPKKVCSIDSREMLLVEFA